MNEVTPWIKDYFLNLATTHGSDFNTVPPAPKLKKCQLRKVLTSEAKDYFWVVLSDREHEVPGRIPKEVAEQCVRDTKRGTRFTQHTGSLIEIRDFSPLLIRVEDVPSTSTHRKDLALDIRRVRLRGAAGEAVWGSPKPLDDVQDWKEWLHELRKPDGNPDILKVREKQRNEAKVVEQFVEPSEPLPDLGHRPNLVTYAPAAAQPKAASTVSALVERSPMQRYRRKWKKAVPGLDEFAQRLQIPEDVRSKISEKQAGREAKSKSRSSARGALEIGSSPARLSSVPRATTPGEWLTSPGVLGRLFNDRETEMSSDVDSSRLSTPFDIFHDVEMDEVEEQQEPEIVPETPQIALDSQTQHLTPPPPAQPPRQRSPLPTSSNPQMQNHQTSPSSIHTSVQAVSGSQLPSSEKPPAWAGLADESSCGPSFVLPWTQNDDPRVAVLKPTAGSNQPPQENATKPIEEPAQPNAFKPPQESNAISKDVPCGPDFGESVFQAIEKAFQQGDTEKMASTTHDAPVALPTATVTVAQLPPPKPRSRPPSKAIQKSRGPSPLGRPTATERLESPTRQPFQALNRRVPVPKVGPTREPIGGRNENGGATMVLIPASDETKLSSSSKQDSSSQPVQSSQSIPSSLPIPPSAPLTSSQPVPSPEPQIQRSMSQTDKSVAQEGDSVVVQVNESVADIEALQDPTGITQSSLEYVSTQENKVAVDLVPQKSVERPAEVVVVEKVTDEPQEGSLPQIAVIREVGSPGSASEELDELESGSEVGDHSSVTKRKPKPVLPNSPLESHPRKPPKPPRAPNPASRAASVAEKVPLRSPSSRLPPKPVVLIERKHTSIIPTDEQASAPQKRRHPSPSEEGFPMPQPVKRSRVHGHRRPVQTMLPPVSRTPSPLPQERNHPVVSDLSHSAKGKGRAEGIKGLENISFSKDVGREQGFQAKAKKAPDTGTKRKPSDAFSAQDNSRDVKRLKVDPEPAPRKLVKQLSFVDPDKLKWPFRSKQQAPKTSAQQGTTATATAEACAVEEPDEDGRKSKYFNPQLYREPEYARMIAALEVEHPHKVIRSSTHENDRDSENIRLRFDPQKSKADRQLPGKSQKTSRLLNGCESPDRPAAHARIQDSEPVEDVVGDFVATGPQWPMARKLGSFAPDLNPPSLPGLPGGRLMNKRLREILIRTGKARTREAKAAESNLNGRLR
ncbi:hypothetical protein BJ322DRAFT_1173015 [Thelephora terrestris]|uniref:Telomere replication protein EST3 n=1 Tax=Thelephora terrestris TaxID=56493 RepID=A0A9P6H4C7_9AGAM|nr:hypothetical protein BJ322DRAFT_1173015 [Thelephora terrestris]